MCTGALHDHEVGKATVPRAIQRRGDMGRCIGAFLSLRARSDRDIWVSPYKDIQGTTKRLVLFLFLPFLDKGEIRRTLIDVKYNKERNYELSQEKQ